MEHPMPSICWRTKYAAAFMDNGKMTIRYRFPYANKREAALLGAYNLTPADRLPYYQNLSAMIERNLLVTEYLRDESVPSILTFENAFQKDEENNIICVYCLPSEPVTPITLSLFAADCNALSTFNVFLRLTHILRDIHKTPMAPVLRYLDLDDVYLTSSERILLGGFYYASANDLQAPPPFLPDSAQLAPDDILRDENGSIGTDMYILCRIAWNIFSGLPWNSIHTPQSLRIPPRYAPPALIRVLELGLSGDPDCFYTFRKQMLQCHKELSKSEFAKLTIPMCAAHKKEYFFTPKEPIAIETALKQ